MRVSLQEFIGIVYGAIVPAMAQGQNVGAMNPNIPEKPFIEWAYNIKADTLVVLFFDRQPVQSSLPYEEVQIPGFGMLCAQAVQGAAALVQNGPFDGGCDCPDCRGESDRRPLDSGGGFMGFQRKGDGEDRIGFRPGGQ
jgi:hypothetical protein